MQYSSIINAVFILPSQKFPGNDCECGCRY